MNAHGLFYFIFFFVLLRVIVVSSTIFCCGCLAVNLFASWFDPKVGT